MHSYNVCPSFTLPPRRPMSGGPEARLQAGAAPPADAPSLHPAAALPVAPLTAPPGWLSRATLEQPQYSIQLPGGFWQDLLTPPVWTTAAESSVPEEAQPKQEDTMSSRDQQDKHLPADTSVKGERKLECQVCGKTFRFKSDLTRHSVTHTGVRDFECTVCGKKFTQKPHLSKHILTHTGVRDYECTVCAKKFSVKFALMRHSLTHTGVRNHECQECGKKFAQKYHLNQHVLTHTY